MNKKLISLLLMITLLFSMSISVFGVYDTDPIGPDTIAPPIEVIQTK